MNGSNRQGPGVGRPYLHSTQQGLPGIQSRPSVDSSNPATVAALDAAIPKQGWQCRAMSEARPAVRGLRFSSWQCPQVSACVLGWCGPGYCATDDARRKEGAGGGCA